MKILQEENNDIEDTLRSIGLPMAFDLIKQVAGARVVDTDTLRTYCNGTITFIKKFLKKLDEIERNQKKTEAKESFESLIAKRINDD